MANGAWSSTPIAAMRDRALQPTLFGRSLFALISVLASPLVSGIASASTTTDLETRVRGLEFPAQVRAGLEAAPSLGLHRGYEPMYDDLAPDSPLAAKSVVVPRAAAAVDDILSGSKPGRPTKGHTTQFERPGGFGKASNDFDSLGLSNVKGIPGGGRVGQLPDGRTVVVRPSSKGGPPTLEIQSGKNRIKIRFGD